MQTAVFSDQELDLLLDQVYQWGRDFAATPAFELLTESEQDEAESVVLCFTEFMYVYQGQRPSEWSPVGLEECCLHTLPAQLAAESGFFKALPVVLKPFLIFLSEQQHLPSTQALQERLEQIQTRILPTAMNSEKWSHEKIFLMAAIQDGLDLETSEQIAAFSNYYQEQLSFGTSSAEKAAPKSTPPAF